MALQKILSSRLMKPIGWVRLLCQQPSELSDSSIHETPLEDDLIEQKRNKSRLKEYHYKVHKHLVTPLNDDEKIVETLRRQRRLYGRYGTASGVNVAMLWPSKEELELEKEYEKVARPDSVQQMIAIAKQAKEDEELATQKRQEELKQKVAKLEQWKKEVRDRVKKQEEDARLAKEKKERLIEEVRQILGFQVDPKDERFKEALMQKEREEKKAKKAAKKLRYQQQLIEKLKMEAESAKAKDSASGDASTAK